jgi:hypothetical protein
MANKQNPTWIEVIAEIGIWFDGEEVFSITEEIVPKLLSSLNEREKKVLELYHGINCSRSTFKQIGAVMGVSGNRCAQIRNKADRKIRWQLHHGKRIVNTRVLVAVMERIVSKLSQCSSEIFNQAIQELLEEKKFTQGEAEEFRRIFS